ncbi:MAG: DUF2723 domain-containing protein [Caldilineaceae bacterium]|nr:DUF2723 domain-containing protein [Caldilineaceae bacterium]
MRSSHTSNRISDRQIGLLLFALVLGNYLRTLAPGMLAGDPGEFQFAAWRLGLAHPTGYPLYMMLGWFWQHSLALLGVNPATALNALSAVCAAVAVALLYRLMCAWLPGGLSLRRLTAIFTALLFAANPTFWNQSLIAEVYALHILFVVAILLSLGIRAQEPAGRDGQVATRPAPSLPSAIVPALLIGLSLTHHLMTLWLLPGIVLYLLWAHYRAPGATVLKLHGAKEAIMVLLALGLPLLLYFYVPLRSGPAASPWYHQPLGDQVLTLYQNDWPSFLRFMSGRSISVGFRSVADAAAQVGFAMTQWRLHFTWLGLLLMGIGLYSLMAQKRWSILTLTLVYALIQQLFNLFYAIDDIYVYYIPLYLMGAIWAGFGVHWLASANWLQKFSSSAAAPASSAPAPISASANSAANVFLPLVLLLLPFYLVRSYLPQVDQSEAVGARVRWEEILAAAPPANAILISNDRNEIVPLFYLQNVEGRAGGMAGLFPLIAPEARFADVGATIETALTAGAGRPVYLIKPMPGLEARFELAPGAAPLVEVTGLAAATDALVAVDLPFGPLTLLGYTLAQQGAEMSVTLHWRVDERLAADYTTTVQLYDANLQKVGQDDRAAGGVFYPTSLWKPGQILLDRHAVMLTGQTPTAMLVGMYTGAEIDLLAPPLEIHF